jgi:hypothetical protein
MALIELTTKVENVDREEFFSVDGEVVTIPVETPPYLAMIYLETIRTSGPDRAVALVLEELIGQRGIKLLASAKGMTAGQLKQVMAIVEKKITDLMEEAQGN